MSEKEVAFAICHVLREMGYRKESNQYYVKIKGQPLVLRNMNLHNWWGCKHHDWNQMGYKLYKILEESWLKDKQGYICSVPDFEQIQELAKTKNIELTNIKERRIILRDLIVYYRKTRNDSRAFEKYMNGIHIKHASDFKCVECGEQAEVFFPVMDPDIPSYPYCKKCADKAQRELFIKLCEINKK